MNAKTNSETILSLLAQEKTCYAQLLEKVNIQKKALEMENESRVLGIVEKKQSDLETIRQLDEKIQTTRNNMSEEEIQSLEPGTKSIRGEIEMILNHIINLENECERILIQSRDELQTQMKGLRQGKNMLKSYGRSQRGPSKISKNI